MLVYNVKETRSLRVKVSCSSIIPRFVSHQILIWNRMRLKNRQFLSDMKTALTIDWMLNGKKWASSQIYFQIFFSKTFFSFWSNFRTSRIKLRLALLARLKVKEHWLISKFSIRCVKLECLSKIFSKLIFNFYFQKDFFLLFDPILELLALSFDWLCLRD